MPRKSNASHMMNTNKCHVFLPLFLSNTHELANSLVYRIVLNKTSEQILEPKKKKKKPPLVKFQTKEISIYSVVLS